MSYKEYKKHADIVNSLVASSGEEIMKEMFISIFDAFPTFMGVAVIGSTPSWNDGDACEHSSEIDFCYYDYIDDSDDLPENEMTDAIEEEVYSLIDEYLIERIYGTDYKVLAYRENGEIVVEHEYYDCGY